MCAHQLQSLLKEQRCNKNLMWNSYLQQDSWKSAATQQDCSALLCNIDTRINTLTAGLQIYIVPRFQPKTSRFRLLYQHHSSSADCTRELFKSWNRSASLLLCTWKNIFGWGWRIFCEWRHKRSSFWVILPHVTWPRAQLPGQSISLKFSLETRLKSESFQPLIDFLAFMV